MVWNPMVVQGHNQVLPSYLFQGRRTYDISIYECQRVSMVRVIFAGRRICLGESLAKVELLLFLANVLHMFSIRFPDDQPNPSVEPAGGVLQAPHPYKAVFVPRG
jgi:cytochrome P450